MRRVSADLVCHLMGEHHQ